MNMDNIKILAVGNGINRNKRSYHIDAVLDAINEYNKTHEENFLSELDDYYFNSMHKHSICTSWSLQCLDVIDAKEFTNVYREFIEENKYGRITNFNGQISIPRIKCSKSNGSNIKYDSRKLFDDLGK